MEGREGWKESYGRKWLPLRKVLQALLKCQFVVSLLSQRGVPLHTASLHKQTDRQTDTFPFNKNSNIGAQSGSCTASAVIVGNGGKVTEMWSPGLSSRGILS